MITTIRKQVKGSTYRYVIFFIVAIMIFGFASSLFIKTERAGHVSWAIRVNGQEISYRDFAREVHRQSEFLAHFRAQYGQYADFIFQSMGWKVDPKSLALDALVREELINQYAHKCGIRIHSDSIVHSVNDASFAQQYLANVVPAFLFNQAGVLDQDILRSYLQRSGISMKEFEAHVERALVAFELMNIVGTSFYLPQFDIVQECIAKKMGKKFAIVTFDYDKFLSEQKKIAVSDSDLHIFYDTQNKQLRRYWVPEKRSGIVWKCEPHHYGIVVSDDEIMRYYEDNKAKSYVESPIKVEVSQISEKDLMAHHHGMTIEQAQQELRANPHSLHTAWKVVAPFARGEKKDAFERAAFLLQNEGDISSVIETPEGKVIIKLIKRIPRVYKSLSAVKNEIKTKLMTKKFDKEFTTDMKGLIAAGDTVALESFITKKTRTKETIAKATKEESRSAHELFSLKKGDYGFYLDNGVGYIVMVTDIQERYLPAIADIKDTVKDDYYDQQTKNGMNIRLDEVLEQAKETDCDTLSKQYGLSIEHTALIYAHNDALLQDFEKKDLPVHEMINLEKEGSIIVHKGKKNNFLIKLEEVEQYNEEKLHSAQKELESHLRAMRTKTYLEGFVASLHRNATIETNEIIFINDEKYSE